MPKVVNAFPPNFADICKALPAVKNNPRIVFTYAPDIYYRGPGGLSYDLMKHEETHIRQQEAMGVKEWWKNYLQDPQFRLSQEVEAYQNQYKALEIYNRSERRRILDKIVGDLSGAMYGKILSKEEAKKAITND